jgi:L-2-hydroxyglutarate oxidase LhgO
MRSWLAECCRTFAKEYFEYLRGFWIEVVKSPYVIFVWGASGLFLAIRRK